MADPMGYLMAFEDGPLATRTNVETVASKFEGRAGQPGRMVVSRDLFGWPLPARLGVLCHAGVDEVALWDAERDELRSPNAVVYAKVSESQLTDDSNDRVMRGAAYRLEP